jgi:hypothetical protein
MNLRTLLHRSLGLAAVVFLAGQAALGSQAVPVPAELALASPEIQRFVKQAIEDRFAARDLPDGNLLGTSARVAVREELPRAGLRLGAAALPQRDGYAFYVISQAAAQLEADRKGREVIFITADAPSVTGEVATISLGVDFAAPKDPKRAKLCCCRGEAQFRRNDGRWTFVKWMSTICS